VVLLRNRWGDRVIITTSKLSPVEQRFYKKYGMEFSEKGIARHVLEQEDIPLISSFSSRVLQGPSRISSSSMTGGGSIRSSP